MPFFMRNKTRLNTGKPNANKSKADQKPLTDVEKTKRKRKLVSSEEIPSDSGGESDVEPDQGEVSSSEEDIETPQEKRLRLAKEYLGQLQEQEDEEKDHADFVNDPISDRLQQDVLEQAGRLHKKVAQEVVCPCAADLRVLRGHSLPVTCLVVTHDDKHIFSAGKDCNIIKWDVKSGKKIKVIPGGRKGTEDTHKGHTAHILCLAISSDGQYLVSGDMNNLIHLWDPKTCELLHTFRGHRDTVSGLAFRKGTHQLFSASHDRTVKIWNVDERAYVETLFGHQDCITGVDSLTRDRAVTSGGRDHSVRVWKVLEESQLVFHGHKGSIDCISLINEEHFISGADDNSLAVYGVLKKKPLVTVRNAHQGGEDGAAKDGGENWICSVAALTNTDLAASGSSDGCVRLWCCRGDFKALQPVAKIPITGFVNDLRFSTSGEFLVAAVGQEHRLGRWWRNKEARNSIVIIPLKRNKENGASPNET